MFDLQKSKDAKPVSSGNQSLVSFENFKKTYTMQRARDLAEHAKVSMAKDKEIVALKKKIAGLEEELHNSVSSDFLFTNEARCEIFKTVAFFND